MENYESIHSIVIILKTTMTTLILFPISPNNHSNSLSQWEWHWAIHVIFSIFSLLSLICFCDFFLLWCNLAYLRVERDCAVAPASKKTTLVALNEWNCIPRFNFTNPLSILCFRMIKTLSRFVHSVRGRGIYWIESLILEMFPHHTHSVAYRHALFQLKFSFVVQTHEKPRLNFSN